MIYLGGTAISTDIEMIPHTLTADECPTNTYYREFQVSKQSPNMRTCVCEDHCSWDMCNLDHPPEDCLGNITGKWQWDFLKDTWIAQVDLGNEISNLV